jgi:hypothetical protein
VAGTRSWTVDVETAAPHRIVRWETGAGARAELLAGERMKYWEMNAERFADRVSALGLTPRPMRTP